MAGHMYNLCEEKVSLADLRGLSRPREQLFCVTDHNYTHCSVYMGASHRI